MNSDHLIALAVGHSRLVNGRIEGGATGITGENEWHYNSILARVIADDLVSVHGIRSKIYDQYDGSGYSSAQRWLAGQIKADGCTAAVELHFNSAGPTARGHEWLYWHSSSNGKRLATCVDSEFRRYESGIPARGTKSKQSWDRGSEFLRGTHCPAVIAEPFFGSNEQDWEIATRDFQRIGAAIARGIADWCG